MKDWKPISINELNEEILKTRSELSEEILNFWNAIRIKPQKWKEPEFGIQGGGFWVIAICGKKVVWYNDIEDGFNISSYNDYGEILEYRCNQDEFNWAIIKIFDFVKTGGSLRDQRSPPQPLND